MWKWKFSKNGQICTESQQKEMEPENSLENDIFNKNFLNLTQKITFEKFEKIYVFVYGNHQIRKLIY